MGAKPASPKLTQRRPVQIDCQNVCPCVRVRACGRVKIVHARALIEVQQCNNACARRCNESRARRSLSEMSANNCTHTESTPHAAAAASELMTYKFRQFRQFSVRRILHTWSAHCAAAAEALQFGHALRMLENHYTALMDNVYDGLQCARWRADTNNKNAHTHRNKKTRLPFKCLHNAIAVSCAHAVV